MAFQIIKSWLKKYPHGNVEVVKVVEVPTEERINNCWFINADKL